MSLIKALSVYTKLRGSPHDEEGIVAGLPYNDNPMDFEFMERAALRMGVEVKKEFRPLEDLVHFSLPCILLLKDGTCPILLKITKTHAIYVELDSWTEQKTIEINLLQEIYSGEAIFFSHTLKPETTFFSIFGWFFDILKQHKHLYIQAAVAGAIVNILLIAATFYSLIIYDRVIPHQGFDTLWVLTLGVMLIYVFDGLLKVIRAHFLDQASKKADIHMGSDLFEKILNVRMESRPVSSASMAFHLKEFESVREFLSSTTLVTLSDLPFVILILIVIAMMGGYIVLVPIVGIILILMTTVIVQPALAGYVQKFNKITENKYASLINAITNLETVKSFNMHRKIQTQWENTLSQSTEVGNELKSFSHVVSSVTMFIQNLAYVFLIVVGVYLISNNNLSFGGLIACSILSSRALGPVSQVVGLIGRLNQTVLAVKELSQIMNAPQERSGSIAYQSHPNFKGTIEFVNVDFSYPHQRLKSLKNFNLKIPAGSRIGILGRIGSGKTTLEKLILGLYQPNYGHLLFDEVEAAQLDPFELRKHIGYVPQDVTLWRGTLKYNILAGASDVSEEFFLKICEIAGVTDFARLHPLGYNMPIAEDGSGLSGGQKQSLAIARALAVNPKIILLDEPTASMDPQSEAAFVKRLNDYLTDQTVIVITHRTPIMNILNRIVIVEGGQVFLDGPRDQVLSKIHQTIEQAKAKAQAQEQTQSSVQDKSSHIGKPQSDESRP